MYGHSAFTETAAEKVCGNHNRWYGYRDAIVNGGEQESLSSSAASAGDAYTGGVYVFKRGEKIDGANTVVKLESEDLGV
jgi:hypothetical protein